ncbi:hypothetical protein HYU17_01385 [Candidatus Woesearchaeota archaeon]|nr:hypothetical protein [Candidatus Woesearchaeota archaeon]
MAPIGTVCGIDGKGNYKVRSLDWPRMVILTRSGGLHLSDGTQVDFVVDTFGEHVDFSRRYHTVKEPSKTGGKGSQAPASGIELVLRDNATYDVLVLVKGPMGATASHAIETTRAGGDICDMRYILTGGALGRLGAVELAEALGVSPDKVVSDSFRHDTHSWGNTPSALPYVSAVPGNIYRNALEARITQELAKRSGQLRTS